MHYSQSQYMSMGTGGIPGTFPTGKVKAWLVEYYPRFKWTRTIVNDFFAWYKEAVQVEGLTPWIQTVVGDKTATKQYIANKTGSPPEIVASFLVALGTLAKNGEIDNKWVAVTKPTTQRNIFEKTGDVLTKQSDTIKKVMTTVTVVGIAAGLYFLSPAIKRIFKKRKK